MGEGVRWTQIDERVIESDPHHLSCERAVFPGVSGGDPGKHRVASKNSEKQGLETSTTYLARYAPHQLSSIVRCQMDIYSHISSS